MQDPPALPRRLTDVHAIVAVGTMVWFLATAGLFIAHLAAGRPLDIWFTTCLCGALLGVVGFGIMGWQRSAVRRGSRGAQQGLD